MRGLDDRVGYEIGVWEEGESWVREWGLRGRWESGVWEEGEIVRWESGVRYWGERVG